MEIDIRHLVENPTSIKFSDSKKALHAVYLQRTGGNESEPVWIDTYNTDPSIAIGCREDAENLIKSIQKAIDLGWFDK